MKSMLKKSIFLMLAIICITIIYSSKVNAVSISLELSGDGIQNANGRYLCTEKIPVGGILVVKAEQVTRNDMHVGGIPTGETNRSDVTSECEWKSSNEQVAKVENGNISGVAEGVAEITVTYDGQDIKFDVYVEGEVVYGFGANIGIVQKDKIKTIVMGKTLQLDIEGVETLSNIENKDVNWSSSDEKVAKVDSNGLVTAIGVGKATIKAEYGTYDDTYEIYVQEVDNLEPPIQIIDDNYDFSSSKKEITINVGASDTLEITAKLKEGLSIIQIAKMEKDNWDVEWKIEDETIAKCVPEKGIENNIYGITQIAGRAQIQGLKAGTTQLLIKVKVSANRVEEIKIPITVKDINTKKDDENEKNKDSNNKDGNNKEEKDDTKSPKRIPQAGGRYVVITMLGIVSTALIVITYRKLKR